MATNLAAIVTDDADLDHITPLLHKIVQRQPQFRVLLVIADYERSYRDDYRVRYLGTLGVAVHHVADELVHRALQPLYFAAATAPAWPLRWLAKTVRRVLGRGRLFGSAAHTERFFERGPGRSLSAIVHNHYTPAVLAISDGARRRGVASISVPHAADNFDNRLTRDSMRNYPVPPAFPRSPAHRSIVPSAVTRDRILANGVTTPDRIRVLGSARFCDEWQQVLRRIVPPAAVPAPPGDFKILVLMAKPESNYFETEVLRIIDTIRRLPRVFVAVKLHTRTPVAGRAVAGNVRFFDRETPARALVDWADLTLFSATSAIVDSVVLDRPALFLRRTLNNTITAERFVSSWAVDTRDDLCERIQRLQADAAERTYSREERQALIHELVEPAGREVLDLYVDEIAAVIRDVTAPAPHS